MDSYLWLIRFLNLTDYTSYNAAGEELARYGLDEPDLTVTVNYTAENEDGDEEEEISPAHVRVGGSRIIYEISGDRYEELIAALYDDLRHQEVFWANFDEVYQIDVSLEGTDYTITAEKDGDTRVWSYQEVEQDISDFQNALASLWADSFTSEKPTEKEVTRFTLYLENEHRPEVSVKLYRYDGDPCLAEVDGTPASFVKRSHAVGPIEAIHAIVLN